MSLWAGFARPVASAIYKYCGNSVLSVQLCIVNEKSTSLDLSVKSLPVCTSDDTHAYAYSTAEFQCYRYMINFVLFVQSNMSAPLDSTRLSSCFHSRLLGLIAHLICLIAHLICLSTDNDFIILSEFSEIQGPVPLLTYPPTGMGILASSQILVVIRCSKSRLL